jgi:hypothetical protein
MSEHTDKPKLEVTKETIAFLNSLPREKLYELVAHTQPKEVLARRAWWSFDSCPAGTDPF